MKQKSFIGREKRKSTREEERDRRRQREANANRSVVDSLGLRATDAELIKNRLTFLSRRTIWSERNPMALVFSVSKKDSQGNRQNNNREEKTNGECGAEAQRQKESQQDKYNFLPFKSKDRGRTRGRKENSEEKLFSTSSLKI